MCLGSRALNQAAGGWELCRENEVSENTAPEPCSHPNTMLSIVARRLASLPSGLPLWMFVGVFL